MPLKLSKSQRSIWLYSEFFGSLWLGLHYVINDTYKGVFVVKNCIYYTIFIAHKTWKLKSCLINVRTQPFKRWFLCHWCEQLRDTRESMYISHPFYSCFNSLSGPFRNYACRSCLLKLVLINCILWKVQSAHWKCIIRFLPFWLLWNSSDTLLFCHEEGTDFFASKHLFLLYKTSILMKKWQKWVLSM